MPDEMNTRGDPPSGPPPGPPMLLATLFVLPFYLAVAWLIARFAGMSPLLPEEQRFLYFGLLSAAGLGSAVASFFLRSRTARGGGDLRGLLVGLAFAEVPAVTGLVYFILYRDGVGFLLLLGATLVAFLAHALLRPRG